MASFPLLIILFLPNSGGGPNSSGHRAHSFKSLCRAPHAICRDGSFLNNQKILGGSILIIGFLYTDGCECELNNTVIV